MKASFKWLDRDVAAPGPYLSLVLSEEEFLLAMKDCKSKDSGPWISNDHSDATCHHLKNPRGEAVDVIAMRVRPDMSAMGIAGLLVHESVHVWQNYCNRIGEHSPGREQEAYAIQNIAQALLSEYARRMA